MIYTEQEYDVFSKRMHEQFPKIFSGQYGGFAVGPGWWPIIESLCSNIQRHIDYKQEQKEKSEENFLRYYELLIDKRHKNNSESIRVNWYRSIEFLKDFGGQTIMFSQINTKFCENSTF